MGDRIKDIQSLDPLPDVDDPEVGKYSVSCTATESVKAWNGETQTKLWFQSRTLRADTIHRISSIQLFTYSHNQGWATFLDLGVWTWFELAILDPSSSKPKGVWMSHQNWKTGRECHWEAGEVFDRRKDLLRLLEDGDKISVRICARFRQWNLTAQEGHMVIEIGDDPSPQEPFEHSKLSSLANCGNPFRIVTLQKGDEKENISCQIFPTTLENVAATPYTSISHYWKHLKDDRPESEIIVNKKPFKVTKNVLQLLRKLRNPNGDVNLWIDVLCIKQSDRDEKSQQVGIMGEIYKKSEKGILWLGEARDDNEKKSAILATKFLEELARQSTKLNEYFTEEGERADVKPEYKAKFDALARMLNLGWWRRIWVIQEMVLPPQVEFLYASSDPVCYDTLKGMRDSLNGRDQTDRDLRNRLRGEGYDPLLEFERIIVPMISTREEWRDPDKQGSLTLPTLRRRFASSEAGWRQDLFYGLLGMVHSSGSQEPLTPDYTIPEGLAIRKAVHHCLLVENNPLFLQGTRLRSFKDMDPSFQWLADFHVQTTPFKIAWGEEQRLRIVKQFSGGNLGFLDTKPKLLNHGAMLLRGAHVSVITGVGATCEPLDESHRVPGVINQWLGIAERFGEEKFCRIVLNNCVPGRAAGEEYRRATNDDCDRLKKLWEVVKLLKNPGLEELKKLQELLGLQAPREYLATLTPVGLGKDKADNTAETRLIAVTKLLENTVFRNTPELAYHFLVCLWKRKLIVTRTHTNHDASEADTVTEKESIGLAPAGAEKGDMAWVLEGSHVPFILRRCCDGTTYTVIGSAYVHELEKTPASAEFKEIVLH